MSERSRKFLIALAALLSGVTSACHPSAQSVNPEMPKDTPIIIADDGGSGPLATKGGGPTFSLRGKTSWTATDSTNTSFTMSLGSFSWLIADGEPEILDPSTVTSFDLGKQTVSFDLTGTPHVTVTPNNTGKTDKDYCTADKTVLQCNGRIHGNKATFKNEGHTHRSASDDDARDYFLFVPR
jgi:hypothetical protein